MPTDVQEDIFDARVQKVLFEEDARPDDWHGASLDIGFGVGTPGLIWSDSYPSFYFLRDKEYLWAEIPTKELLIRWADFLSSRHLGDDLLFLICQSAPKIISWVTEKIKKW